MTSEIIIYRLNSYKTRVIILEQSLGFVNAALTILAEHGIKPNVRKMLDGWNPWRALAIEKERIVRFEKNIEGARNGSTTEVDADMLKMSVELDRLIRAFPEQIEAVENLRYYFSQYGEEVELLLDNLYSEYNRSDEMLHMPF